MKFLQIFSKTPGYKKFNYTPRFYNPEEEERQERIARIERDAILERAKTDPGAGNPEEIGNYRQRMQGSFRQARKANGSEPAPATSSPTLLRLAIVLVLVVGFISYLEYGKGAAYGIALILIPLFLYSKFINLTRKHGR